MCADTPMFRCFPKRARSFSESSMTGASRGVEALRATAAAADARHASGDAPETKVRCGPHALHGAAGAYGTHTSTPSTCNRDNNTQHHSRSYRLSVRLTLTMSSCGNGSRSSKSFHRMPSASSPRRRARRQTQSCGNSPISCARCRRGRERRLGEAEANRRRSRISSGCWPPCRT